jgi:hypothetical protein
MNTPRAVFALYLFQDSEGIVTVRAEHAGDPGAARNLGVAIVEQLKNLDRQTVTVQPLRSLPRIQ